MSRTSPSEAMERLAMTLNFPRSEPISINELSEKTELSWATTKKYVQLLEVLGRIAPKLSVEEDGVKTLDIGENLYSIKDQKDLQLVIYLFTHARATGSLINELDWEEHEDVLSQYEDTIEELEKLGWIETSEETIQLKPEGVSMAGHTYSRIRNKQLGPHHVRPRNRSRSHTASVLVDDPSGESQYKSKTQADTDWQEEFDRDDFRTTKEVFA